MKNSLEQQSAVALIYSANLTTVENIREYFSSRDYDVVVNSEIDRDPDYVLLCGDAKFVESILATHDFSQSKLLALVISEVGESNHVSFHNVSKIVYINYEKLSPQQVSEVFKFWFTSPTRILNLQNPAVISEQKVLPKTYPETSVPTNTFPSPSRPQPRLDLQESSEINQAQTESDSSRINRVIQEVYGESLTKNENQKRSTRKHPSVSSRILFIVLILFFSGVWYFSAIFLSFASYWGTVTLLERGQTKSSQITLFIGKSFAGQSRLLLFLAQWPFRFLNITSGIRRQEQVLTLLEDVGDVLEDGSHLIEKGRILSTVVVGQLSGVRNTDVSIPSILSQLRTDLPNIHLKVGLISAELSMLSGERLFPFSLPFISKNSQLALYNLQKVRTELTYMENAMSLYANMAGFTGKKTYLLLFQNSIELRPTGGFIGSYGEVTLEEGRIANFLVQDIYAIDGQLKGHVEPPAPIAEILNQEHWYLRDSNWDPDFTKSGETAAWFYEKETGVHVDGVIAISTPVLIDILEATGPIELKDFQDTITAENFYAKSLHYTETNFFPGSTQKKDFLSSIVAKIIEKITHDKNVSSLQIAKSLERGLHGREILFYFPDVQSKQLIAQYGWNGDHIDDHICGRSDIPPLCFPDFIEIIESNMSISKVNYFMKRMIHTMISINENGKISTTMAIKYTNQSTGAADQHAGTYHNYLRIYLPKDAIISGVSLDGIPVRWREKLFEPIPTIPYAEFPSESLSSNIQVVGMLFDVLPQQDALVSLSYVRGAPISMYLQGVDYKLAISKQAGIRDSLLQTTLLYPNGWKATYSPDSLEPTVANVSRIEYNTILNNDVVMNVRFQKETEKL